MTRKICFIYTETNGLHTINNEKVSKKNIYGIARLITLNYLIGYRENGKFVQLKKVREILTPKCINFDEIATKFHGITKDIATKKGTDSEKVMERFKNDLNNVKVIVSHNLSFHLKAIQAECFRTCTYIDFSNYILIDTISFFHKLEYPKLRLLAKEILKKDYSDKKQRFNLILIKKIFIKLYNKYEKSIKVA